MKAILYITFLVLLNPICSFSQKPNKTINDTVFEVGDIIQLPKIISCLGRELCKDAEWKNKDSIKTATDFINTQSNFHFQLQYHTDLRGSIKNNLKLSQFRVRTILREIKYLLNDTTQLTAKGFGESQPIISQKEIDRIKDRVKQEELYAINKRTVLVVTGKKQ